MKIISVKAEAFTIPLPRKFHGSNYIYTHKKGMFAHAKTDSDVSGICYLGDDFGLGKQIANAFNEDFSKILIGRDPADLANIWDDMRPLVRDILGDRRVALHAQALADILCWDLYAKGQNLSIVDLLGRQRSQVPIMAIAGYYSPHRTSINLISETRDLIALGCSGMKLKVGGMSVAEDVERVKVVRDTGGSSFNLAVDANQAWSLKEAIEFANACESLNLNWIEEPVYWDDDINDLAILKKETEIPICAGQSEVTVAGVARMIEAGAIDICSLHPGYVGGVTPWLKSAELARQNGLRVANTGEPQLSASLMLTCEHGMSVEIYHPDRDPVFPLHCPAFAERFDGQIRPVDLKGWGIVPAEY